MQPPVRTILQSSGMIILSLLISVVFIFAGHSFQSPFAFLPIAFLLLVDIFIRMLQSREKPQLEVERQVPGTDFLQNTPIQVHLKISNKGKEAFRGRIVDTLPGANNILSGKNDLYVYIPANSTIHLKYVFNHFFRGKHQIGPLRYVAFSANEYWSYTDEIQVIDKFVILPRPTNLNAFPNIAKKLRSIGGPFPSKHAGDGWSFTGIRDYQQTDSMRRINWKATARTGELQTNEYELQRSSKFLIVLDTTVEPSEIFERTIQSIMGIAEFLINNYCAIGVATIGQYNMYFPPIKTRKQLRELARFLTNVNASVIPNIALFKQRVHSILNKIEPNNDVLYFTTMNDMRVQVYLADYLPRAGNVTYFVPNYQALLNNEVQSATDVKVLIELFTLHRTVADSELTKKKHITVEYWNPRKGFGEREMLYRRRH